MRDAIDALFGGTGTGAGQETPPEATGEPTGALPDLKTEPSAEFRGSFLKDGALDAEKALKAAWDSKRDRDRLATKVSSLEAAAAEGVGADRAAYLADLDLAKLQEAAPKAYGGSEADKEALGNLFDAARASGLSVKKAQQLAGEYYTRVNGLLKDPDTRTADDRRAEAVKTHPNGALIAADVKAWLDQRHSSEAFSERELGAIGTMLETPEGLSVLWRLSRQGNAAPPDLSGTTRGVTDPDAERREVMRLLGTQDPEEWQRIKHDVLRRYEALDAA